MKPTTVLGAAALVSVASATTTILLMETDVETERAAARPNADLGARVDALLERQKELEETIVELRLLAESRP